jgi:hypothetical protein
MADEMIAMMWIALCKALIVKGKGLHPSSIKKICSLAFGIAQSDANKQKKDLYSDDFKKLRAKHANNPAGLKPEELMEVLEGYEFCSKFEKAVMQGMEAVYAYVTSKKYTADATPACSYTSSMVNTPSTSYVSVNADKELRMKKLELENLELQSKLANVILSSRSRTVDDDVPRRSNTKPSTSQADEIAEIDAQIARLQGKSSKPSTSQADKIAEIDEQIAMLKGKSSKPSTSQSDKIAEIEAQIAKLAELSSKKRT